MEDKTITAIVSDRTRRAWRVLLGTDVVYKLLALMVLTPAASIVLRFSISLSGRAVLADQDVLFFLLGPTGCLSLMVFGALQAGIFAFEQSTLLGVLAHDRPESVTVPRALMMGGERARSILLACASIVCMLFAVTIPVVIGLGVLYETLLSDHDINFYLNQRPAEFWFAVVPATMLIVAWSLLALWWLVNWILVLPLVLFEDYGPVEALRQSRKRTKGQRWKMVVRILAWLAANAAVSAVITSLLIWGFRWLIPADSYSLPALVLMVGGALVAWFVAQFLINVVASVSLAILLFACYRVEADDSFQRSWQHRWSAAQRRQVPAILRSGRTILLLVVVGGIATLGLGAVLLHSASLPEMTAITAHRGASFKAPENTLAAIEQAIADHADWVEIDVQQTADDQVVVFHDSDFMRVAGKKLKIWEATAADLARIDVGSWFDRRFSDQRVPTLDQVLAVCKGHIKVNIELKFTGHENDLEDKVVRIVEGRGMQHNVVVMSLNRAAVERMKELRPGWKAGLLLSVIAGDYTEFEADFLAVNARLARPVLIHTMHRHGKQVHAWTVNDPATMSLMMSRGVDVLITDRPDVAGQVQQTRAALSPAERLLLEFGEILGIPMVVAAQ